MRNNIKDKIADKTTPKEKVAALESRVRYIDGHERKRAAALIFLGSLFGLLGFTFAFITGVMKSTEDRYNGDGDYLWPSKQGYFPSTVSEMVSDPTDPAGKAFFAFEFIAAIFIFLSWYPYSLANVYTGDDDVLCCGLSSAILRQFIPAPGMMLVATVTTTPIATATVRDYFTIFIHLTGAMMMFAGYIIFEGKLLGMFGMKHPESSKVHHNISEQETKWRRSLLWGVCANYVGFFALQILMGLPGIGNVLCCNDEYDMDWSPPKLLNTASGIFLAIKVLSYLAEVICGLSLLSSHMVIWYYCSERHIDLEDELVQMGGDQMGGD